MERSHLLVLTGLATVLLLGAILTYVIINRPDPAEPSEASLVLESNEIQSFTDLQGNPISLEQFEGKIRVVNVWASWSPLSADELRDMQRFAADYAGNDVVFIAINRKEHAALAQQYLDAHGIGGELVFVIDENDTFYASVGGYAMPETIVFDASGNKTRHIRGVLTYEDLAQIVEDSR